MHGAYCRWSNEHHIQARVRTAAIERKLLELVIHKTSEANVGVVHNRGEAVYKYEDVRKLDRT